MSNDTSRSVPPRWADGSFAYGRIERLGFGNRPGPTPAPVDDPTVP